MRNKVSCLSESLLVCICASAYLPQYFHLQTYLFYEWNEIDAMMTTQTYKNINLNDLIALCRNREYDKYVSIGISLELILTT